MATRRRVLTVVGLVIMVVALVTADIGGGDGDGADDAGTPAPSATTVRPPSGSTGRAPSGSVFADAVTAQFVERDIDPGAACDATDPVARRILADYGAMFVARGVTSPPACRFTTADEIRTFEAEVDTATATLEGVTITLQRPALDALRAAVADAAAAGLTITPRDTDAAARSFETSRQLWLTRVEDGLAGYVADGQIDMALADEIRAMTIERQIGAILDLEARGLPFGLGRTGSIMSSAAPPGASQHHALIAFDVAEFENPEVRRILADHGWFQTVAGDAPHFTYLGVSDSELPSLGLRAVHQEPYAYWVPDVDP